METKKERKMSIIPWIITTVLFGLGLIYIIYLGVSAVLIDKQSDAGSQLGYVILVALVLLPTLLIAIAPAVVLGGLGIGFGIVCKKQEVKGAKAIIVINIVLLALFILTFAGTLIALNLQ